MVMTVPLHGKKAAGRVALVDDEDYDLVMQHRWRVYERKRPGKRPQGPYAVTSVVRNGSNCSLQMHVLIMGQRGIDHINHNGLDNQRHNLRLANHSQNNQNQQPPLGFTSQYKGVYLRKKSGLWHAVIKLDGRSRHIGDFASEAEAAYAYDAAARELFGEFACPNFQDEPTQAMRDQWRTEAETRRAAVMTDGARRSGVAHVAWWATIQPETRTCIACGGEYQSRSMQKSYYCSNKCKLRELRKRRAREREAERAGMLF